MNLLISDTQIKAKTFIGRSCFFVFVPLNFGMILQSTYSVKWSLNIRSSKSYLKALKTFKRYFYFVVLFNNFFLSVLRGTAF